MIGARPGGERLGLGRGDLALSRVYERIGQIVEQDVSLAGAVDREAAASVMPRCRPALYCLTLNLFGNCSAAERPHRQPIDFIGRSERIRTSDPLVPNEVRYQTALHSDMVRSLRPERPYIRAARGAQAALQPL